MEAKRDLDKYKARRVKGVELFERGYRPSEVAGMVGVSRQAVWQWLNAWRRGGDAALSRVRHKGRPPKLTPPQLRRLAAMLRRRATLHGHSGGRWSGPEVARLISKEFRVAFNPQYVPRLMRALGWNCTREHAPVESRGTRRSIR